MARRSSTPPPAEDFPEKIVDIDVEEEMQGAFLEYAYSVIYSRALPDARDGLKPVQRRILYGMSELGLRPERGHVKSSRVVGEVMGKYHPHGDASIYDALVRMAQPFTMRLPLVDGHGNFGSLDDGPAASRYTEARQAAAALLMTGGLDEETVDFVPNYDDQLLQPAVMPAAYPNLLVNGGSGIAVGMATNMPPHNLVEVIGAARHLIANPSCSLDDLMKFVPGPDLPCGGKIVGLEGIRDAYLTGRGSFRTRSTTRIENVTPRKKGIVVTELPYMVGPEKVIEKIKDLVQAKKLQGISDVKDLTDRTHGLQLVIEIKNGFHPEAVLEQLFKLTPMEDSFGINNVALVEGQPRTLGLKDLLRVYVDFRTDVVRRRTAYRLRKREERLHLVEGLLIAILDIDEVIQLIRTSDDAAVAKDRLMDVFDLSELQATYILDLQLRRLTKFSRVELEAEQAELQRQIEALRAILGDEKLLLRTVSTELGEVAKAHGTPRRTVLLESAGTPLTATTPMEVVDDPCWVLMSSTGLMARTTSDDPLSGGGGRHKHDAVIAAVRTTARGSVGLVTSRGRMIRLSALELPTLPPTNGAPSLSGGAPLAAFVDLPRGEEPLTIISLSTDSPGLAVGTAQGVVKRVATDYPGHRDDWEVIGLRDGDAVVGAVELHHGRGGPRLRHLRRPAAALLRDRRPPAGPGRRWRGRHQAGRRGPRGLLRCGRPGGAQPRGHLQRLLGRAARHRARFAQGHPVRRVPGQGPRHRRRPGAPVPARRGHPRARLGRRRPGPRRRCQRRPGRAARWPPASGTAPASTPRRRSPRSPARCPAPWWTWSDHHGAGSGPRRDAESCARPGRHGHPRAQPARRVLGAVRAGRDQRVRHRLRGAVLGGGGAERALGPRRHDRVAPRRRARRGPRRGLPDGRRSPAADPPARPARRRAPPDVAPGARGRRASPGAPSCSPATSPRRPTCSGCPSTPSRTVTSTPFVAALPALVPSPEPALLVCTNARRDVCCAVRGRPVALQAAAERPGQVWECSHTGGHRFAPTAVLLPHGQTWARLSTAQAVSALDAAARGRGADGAARTGARPRPQPAHRTGPGRGVLRPPADRRGRPHRPVDRGRPRRRPGGARPVQGHAPRRTVLGRARDPHRGAGRTPRLLRQGARAVLAVGLLARLTRTGPPAPALRLTGRRR